MAPQYALYLAGNGYKTVSSAGTAWPLSTTSVPARWVYITAYHTNTGIITAGISTVLAATTGPRSGIALDKGVSALLPVADLNSLWIDGTVTGEGISYVYYLNSVP
jgi:hypothetical protein